MPNKISLKNVSPSDQDALDGFLAQLKSLYRERLHRVILYGHKTRGTQGSDLDVLVVIKDISDRFVEMSRIHQITGPITVDKDILITAIPIDANYLENHRETRFFTDILENGREL